MELDWEQGITHLLPASQPGVRAMSMAKEGSQGHMVHHLASIPSKESGSFVYLLVSGQDLSVLLCFAPWSVLSALVSVKGSESCQTKAEKCPWGQKDPCMEPDFCGDEGLRDQTGGCGCAHCHPVKRQEEAECLDCH